MAPPLTGTAESEGGKFFFSVSKEGSDLRDCRGQGQVTELFIPQHETAGTLYTPDTQ